MSRGAGIKKGGQKASAKVRVRRKKREGECSGFQYLSGTQKDQASEVVRRYVGGKMGTITHSFRSSSDSRPFFQGWKQKKSHVGTGTRDDKPSQRKSQKKKKKEAGR